MMLVLFKRNKKYHILQCNFYVKIHIISNKTNNIYLRMKFYFNNKVSYGKSFIYNYEDFILISTNA